MKFFEKISKVHLNSKKTKRCIQDFSMLMTAQLVALYKKNEEESYRTEYLRRLTYVGFSPEEARRMFEYECRIIKEKSFERLCRQDYMFRSEFNLVIPEFAQEEEYYIKNQLFLCSEITKIWDEAEWHAAWSHESIKSEPVWSEIFRISRHGGANLFIGYVEAMSKLSGVSLDKIRMYSVAEQKLLFKYKWDPQGNRNHPYGENAVSEVNKEQMRTAKPETIAKLYYAEKVGGGKEYLKYSFEDIEKSEKKIEARRLGNLRVKKDTLLGKQRMIFALDAERLWFLSVFFLDDGTFDKFSLDEEAANDAHYEFRDEKKVRGLLYRDGDENKYLHEVFSDYIKENSGYKLLAKIGPAIVTEHRYG